MTGNYDDLYRGYVIAKKTDKLGKKALIEGEEPLDFVRMDVV